jgi:hypothetical protein
VFASAVFKFFVINYSMILFFVLALLVLNNCIYSGVNIWGELLLNGLTSLGISAVVCTVWIVINKGKAVQLVKILRKG